MSLATCIQARNNPIRSFEEFCEKVTEYIDVPGQDLHHTNFNDEEFEAVAQLNDAFGWPSTDNWIEWREGLRQIFWYAQLSSIQRGVLNDNNLGWLSGAPFFLHIANDDPSQVAYLIERDDYRVGDRMSRGRIGRFFAGHVGIDNENLARQMTESFTAENWKYVISRDAHMFKRIYEHGPRSCMSMRQNPHAVEAYGSGDFAILGCYAAADDLDNPETRFAGRGVISLVSNNMIRAYGNVEAMQTAARAMGLPETSNSTYGEMKWDRFVKQTSNRGGYIFPYIDAARTGRIIVDPRGPSRGPSAMWRAIPAENSRDVPTDSLQINPHSQSGRVRSNRTGSAGSWTPELMVHMAAHDEEVRPAWVRLQTRFNEFTHVPDPDVDERTISLNIPWNARPVQVVFECPGCHMDITVAPDDSNIATLHMGVDVCVPCSQNTESVVVPVMTHGVELRDCTHYPDSSQALPLAHLLGDRLVFRPMEVLMLRETLDRDWQHVLIDMSTGYLTYIPGESELFQNSPTIQRRVGVPVSQVLSQFGIQTWDRAYGQEDGSEYNYLESLPFIELCAKDFVIDHFVSTVNSDPFLTRVFDLPGMEPDNKDSLNLALTGDLDGEHHSALVESFCERPLDSYGERYMSRLFANEFLFSTEGWIQVRGQIEEQF